MSIIEEAKKKRKEMISSGVEIRSDFMQGVGRGVHDKTQYLTTNKTGRPTLAKLKEMYKQNAIIRNVVDVPAADMTKNGFKFVCSDNDLQERITTKLSNLKIDTVLRNLVKYDRMYGDGLAAIGVTERGKSVINLSESVPRMADSVTKTSKLVSVDFLHVFSPLKVNQLLINEDVFSSRFGEVADVIITRDTKYTSKDESLGENLQNNVIDISRLLHLRVRHMEDEEWGLSIIETLEDSLKALDISLWSVCQILYDYTFKVYKTSGIEGMSKEEKTELQMMVDYIFSTEALAIIAPEEDLQKHSTNVSGIKDLLEYVWDYLSAATSIPKTKLKGQQAGAIAGAEFDIQNYYSWINETQETQLKPIIEYVVELVMESEEFGVDPHGENIEWEIQFNPLWTASEKELTETRKTQAETDKIYIELGVLKPDEVRAERFGKKGIAGESTYSGDSEDFSKEIYGGEANE